MNLRPYLPSGYHKMKQKIQSSYKKQLLTNQYKLENEPLQDQKLNLQKRIPIQRPSSKIESITTINLMSKQFLSNQKRPNVTSTNFMLYDSIKKITVTNKAEQQRQIASLTKIMTVIVALQFISKYQLQKNLFVRVSSTAAALNGTSAKLTEGVFVKLYDLLYGAMLPSGNDAAFLLAEVLGLLMFYQNIKPQQKQYNDIQSIDLSFYDSTVTFINCFIKQMNRKAKELKMTKTNFSNPHGLGNALNLSTAQDVMILVKYVVNNEEFRSIMSTKQFYCEFYNENMEPYDSRIWKNTNKLLQLGWQGIKTGHTTSAGSCLASLKDGIFIVVLNSSTLQKRFEDTIQTFRWYQQNGNLMIKNRDKNKSEMELN